MCLLSKIANTEEDYRDCKGFIYTVKKIMMSLLDVNR